MTLLYKPDFERAQKYWDAFWAHEIIDRPCAVVWAKKCADAEANPYVQGVEDDFQVMFGKAQRHLDANAFLGEAMPGFRPSFGRFSGCANKSEPCK